MTNFTDEQLNLLLTYMDVSIPTIESPYQPKVEKPRISSSLYHAKGVEKGMTYQSSPYETITALMEKVSDSYTKQPINEQQNGLFEEALALIEAGKEHGVVYDFPTYHEARETMRDRNLEPFNELELLVRYRMDISDATRPIDDLKAQLLDILKEDKQLVLTNPNKVTLDWLLKKTMASKEVVDYAARLEAHRDIVMAKYSAEAERYSYGEQTFAPAVLVATLYVINLQTEQKRRKEHASKKYRFYAEQYIKEYGVQPTEEHAHMIHQKAEKEMLAEYSDSGFSSIQSLFPLGSIQFLQWIGSGEVKTKHTAAKFVSVYLEAGRELSQEERSFWKQMENQMIHFDNGFSNGLSISKEDLVSTDKNPITPKAEDIKDKPQVIQELLLNNKFLRGAKFWFGGKQQGIVLHVQLYKKGVKLFLGGVKNV